MSDRLIAKMWVEQLCLPFSLHRELSPLEFLLVSNIIFLITHVKIVVPKYDIIMSFLAPVDNEQKYAHAE